MWRLGYLRMSQILKLGYWIFLVRQRRINSILVSLWLIGYSVGFMGFIITKNRPNSSKLLFKTCHLYLEVAGKGLDL